MSEMRFRTITETPRRPGDQVFRQSRITWLPVALLGAILITFGLLAIRSHDPVMLLSEGILRIEWCGGSRVTPSVDKAIAMLQTVVAISAPDEPHIRLRVHPTGEFTTGEFTTQAHAKAGLRRRFWSGFVTLLGNVVRCLPF